MRHRIPRISLALTGLTAGTLLLTSRAATAETAYKIQPVARLGERAGDISIPRDHDFELGPLNDQGQLVFSLVQDQETSWGIGRRGRWGAS